MFALSAAANADGDAAVLQVLFEGVRYRQQQTLTVTLDAYQTIQIQEFNGRDLSGTLVVANRNVAVFSGNFHTGQSACMSRPHRSVCLHLSTFVSRTACFVIVVRDILVVVNRYSIPLSVPRDLLFQASRFHRLYHVTTLWSSCRPLRHGVATSWWRRRRSSASRRPTSS